MWVAFAKLWNEKSVDLCEKVLFFLAKYSFILILKDKAYGLSPLQLFPLLCATFEINLR